MYSASEVLLRAENLAITLDGRLILADISLILKAGEIVTLIGPNGAGKSTLLRVLLGLIKRQKGSLWIKPGVRIGYMPQKLSLDPLIPLSVLRFLSLSIGATSAQISEVLNMLAIQHLQTAPIQKISGGELQRVLLARALLGNPQLLILDEPAQGVDVLGQEELYRLITDIRNQKGCGILMVSHDLHLVMAGTHSVVCLNQHICCSGHPSDVSRHPEFVRLFGLKEATGFAIYTHTHNHKHTLDGEICS